MRPSAIALIAFIPCSSSALADCNSEFAQVWQNFMKAGPYHAMMQSKDYSSRSLMTQVDVIIPNKMRQRLPGGSEIIMIGDDAWMSVSGGLFTKSSGPTAEHNNTGMRQGMAIDLQTHTNIRCLGPTTYKNLPVAAYEFDSAAKFNFALRNYRVRLFTAKGLPTFIIVDDTGKSMWHSEQTITYDPSISITPPK